MPKGVYPRSKSSTLTADGVEVYKLFIKNLPVHYYEELMSHANASFDGRLELAAIDAIRKGLQAVRDGLG